MRKFATHLILVSAMVVGLYGCWREPQPHLGVVFAETFIQRYVDLVNTCWEFDRSTNTLYMAVADSSIDGPEYGDCAHWMSCLCCWEPDCQRELCVRHRQLSKKNNDTSYNRMIEKMEQFDTAAIGYNFTKIEITSNADFDENHQTGTPLSDIVTMECNTYKPYINSNYFEETHPPFYQNLASKCTVINKRLCDFTLPDLSVLTVKYFRQKKINHCALNHDFKFTFETTPTLAQQHTLEIVFVSDEGKEFRFNVDVDFSQVATEVEEEK